VDKEKKQETSFPRSIEAICYPNKILISTYYQAKDGFNFLTDMISWIDLQATVEEIGKVARKHLQMSRANVDNPTDFSLVQKAYKNATGLTSIKGQMKDARYVRIADIRTVRYRAN
jgi:hypothetical protein